VDGFRNFYNTSNHKWQNNDVNLLPSTKKIEDNLTSILQKKLKTI